MMMLQLPNPIDVNTPLGDCTAIIIIDYGIDTNSVWLCRMPGGEIKHFLSDDIKIYANPLYGKGWDVVPFPDKDKVSRPPAKARRSTKFLNEKK